MTHTDEYVELQRALGTVESALKSLGAQSEAIKAFTIIDRAFTKRKTQAQVDKIPEDSIRPSHYVAPSRKNNQRSAGEAEIEEAIRAEAPKKDGRSKRWSPERKAAHSERLRARRAAKG